MSTPDQPEPATVTAILNVLNATKDGIAAAKDEIVNLRTDMEADRQASKDRDEHLARYGRRNRFLIVAAAVGLMLDMTATAVAVTAYLDSRHNTATVLQVHDANLAGCEANNVRLAKQKQALTSVLSLASPPPTATPAQREAAAAFLAKANGFISAGWASRNCTIAYPNPNGH